MRKRASLVVVACVAAVLSADDAKAATIDDFLAECDAPTASPALKIGISHCQRFQSDALGGESVFGYYVPPACDPATHAGVRCPVVYYLHGTGGNAGMCGSTPCFGKANSGAPREWTSGPAVDPHSVPDPYNYGTDTWVPMYSLDMIKISPFNFTVLGGYGPERAPGGWLDWNPRYAKGGDTERYPTPPPRFETMLLHELMPYVETHFPTVAEREWRSITGNSQGGLGSSLMFFRHPDLFANMGMISGAGIPGPWMQTYHLDGIEPDPVGEVASTAPAVPVPYQGPMTPLLADNLLFALQTCAELDGCIVGPEAIYLIAYGMGDPAADSAYVRSHNPGPHLAANARAWAGDVQSSNIFYYSGDTIPTHPQEWTDPGELAGEFSQILGEQIILTGNIQLEEAFTRFGIERDFFIRRGTHEGRDHRPFHREHYQYLYEHMRHADGGGNPPPWPDRFDYRAIETDFTIWSWHVKVENRPATEFLYMTDVSCDTATLRGTGLVTLTPPASCGKAAVTVDLGPSHATDEPVTGASKTYGRTVTVTLS